MPSCCLNSKHPAQVFCHMCKKPFCNACFESYHFGVMEQQNKIIDELLNEEWEYEINNLPEDLQCCIDLDILKDPVLHSDCGNLFCRECIMKVSKCPICRYDIKETVLLPVPNAIKNNIADVKVKCKKCHQEMTNEASKTHKQCCEFGCPFGCDSQVTIATLKEHAPKNCPKCVNKCPAFEFGCSWIGHGGSEYQNHLKECEFAKLVPLYEMINKIEKNLSDKMNSLTDKVDTLTNRINQIDNKVDTLADYSFEKETGTLMVYKMYDFDDSSKYPWYFCQIRSLNFDNSLTFIGYYAFYYYSSLKSITFPNSLTSIGEGAFSYCSRLTSITLPNSLTYIGNGAFFNCSSLTSITLPNSLTSIGYEAFNGCSNLTSITIPINCKCPNSFYNGPKVIRK